MIGNICKLNLPPVFKWNLSSINPTIDIKKLKDSEASKILATIQAEMSLINRK